MRILGVLAALSVSCSAFAQTTLDYNSLRHIDLRDLVHHGSHYDVREKKEVKGTALRGTSTLLMRFMENYPQRFVGPIDSSGRINDTVSTTVKFYPDGAKGPEGSANENDVFQISSDFPETRRQTIFSAEFEDIVVEQPETETVSPIYKLRMILFVHDQNHPFAVGGYYFRRLTVRVNWQIPKERETERVQVLSGGNDSAQDIPLSHTKFRVIGDILERKIILEEPTYGIIKTFPIGVGAFDVRTAPGMDRKVVRQLTEEFPNGFVRQEKLNSEPIQSNTRVRTYPSYYRGRPFIGLRTSDGQYRQIGMHYQIDKWGLTRGFVSHACIRVRDKDLYQIDAILNEGPHGTLSIDFRNAQPQYSRYIHPMEKFEENYKQVVYSTRATEPTVKCERSTYSIRFYGQYHTLADGDCLTKVEQVKGSPQPIIDYLLGRSTVEPLTLLTDIEHDPIRLDNGEDVNWQSDGGQEYQQIVVKRRKYLADHVSDFLGNLFGGSNRRPEPQVVYVQPNPRFVPPADIVEVRPAQPVVQQRPQVQTATRSCSPAPKAPKVTSSMSRAEARRATQAKIQEITTNYDCYCRPNPLPNAQEACSNWPGELARWKQYLQDLN